MKNGILLRKFQNPDIIENTTPPSPSRQPSRALWVIAGLLMLMAIVAMFLSGRSRLQADLIFTEGSPITFSADQAIYETASGSVVTPRISFSGVDEAHPLLGVKMVVEGLPSSVVVEDDDIIPAEGVAIEYRIATRHGDKLTLTLSGMNITTSGGVFSLRLRIPEGGLDGTGSLVRIVSSAVSDDDTPLMSELSTKTDEGAQASRPIHDGVLFRLSAVDSSATPMSTSTSTPSTGSGSTQRLSIVLTMPSDTALAINTPYDLSVCAIGDDGTDPSYLGTIVFGLLKQPDSLTGSSARQVLLPDSSTFTPDDQGCHTFDDGLTFLSSGEFVISARDQESPGIFDIASFEVTCGNEVCQPPLENVSICPSDCLSSPVPSPVPTECKAMAASCLVDDECCGGNCALVTGLAESVARQCAPVGCHYEQVICITTPCDPVLVCPDPTPTLVPTTVPELCGPSCPVGRCKVVHSFGPLCVAPSGCGDGPLPCTDGNTMCVTMDGDWSCNHPDLDILPGATCVQNCQSATPTSPPPPTPPYTPMPTGQMPTPVKDGFSVQPLEEVWAHDSVSFQVCALDQRGAVLTTYNGTVFMVVPSFNVDVPLAGTGYTFTSDDRGCRIFEGLVFRQAGAEILTVVDLDDPRVFGSASVVVHGSYPSETPTPPYTPMPTGWPTPTPLCMPNGLFCSGSWVSCCSGVCQEPPGGGSAVCVPVLTSPPPATCDARKGDVTCDGHVNIADLALLADRLAGTITMTRQQEENANVENVPPRDVGRVRLNDLVKLADFVAVRIREL